jgi:undecaprenyl-diphosphatase
MQLGNFVVVPAAAVLAAAFRRWRLAAGLLLAGAGVYVLAKVVKGIVVRGRPEHLLSDVVVRGAAAQGRGFVSGHAAVVVALLTVAWPWLNRPGRIVCAVLAGLVCLARVYVSAHLPLDVVGGAALGLAVGGAVRLLLGRPG